MLMLVATFSLTFTACGSDDDEPNNDKKYEIVGTWTHVYTESTPSVTETWDVNKNGQIITTFTQSGKTIKSEDTTWEYFSSDYYWYIGKGSSPYFKNSDGVISFSYRYPTKAVITGNKLLFNGKIYTREGEVGGSDTDIYTGQPFVGTWQGGNDWNEFYIVLGADGSYTDYAVDGGQKSNKFTGKYRVSGDRIFEPEGCNLYNTWSSEGQGFKYNISGNKMTLSDALTNKFNEPIVLTRQ